MYNFLIQVRISVWRTVLTLGKCFRINTLKLFLTAQKVMQALCLCVCERERHVCVVFVYVCVNPHASNPICDFWNIGRQYILFCMPFPNHTYYKITSYMSAQSHNFLTMWEEIWEKQVLKSALNFSASKHWFTVISQQK